MIPSRFILSIVISNYIGLITFARGYNGLVYLQQALKSTLNRIDRGKTLYIH